jgi:16S rRNA (adenine1518-N6/adenine1519-N6)-dimethyltransferase
LDRSLADALPSRLGAPTNLRVVHADGLALDLSEVISEPYVVVASLPYHVATPILFKLLLTPPRPRRMVLMLQDEVADRVLARTYPLTYLGVAVSMLAEPTLVRRVPAGAFFPSPKVRSAVVRFDLRDRPAVPVDDVARFLTFVRAGFSQPRKQLHNSVAQGLNAHPSAVGEAARAADLDPTRRPGDLSIEEWGRLYAALQGPMDAA